MASTGTTIQTEIDRLKKAKSDIKTAIINKGGTISDTATIDKYAAAIDGISAGGGKVPITMYGFMSGYILNNGGPHAWYSNIEDKSVVDYNPEKRKGFIIKGSGNADNYMTDVYPNIIDIPKDNTFHLWNNTDVTIGASWNVPGIYIIHKDLSETKYRPSNFEFRNGNVLKKEEGLTFSNVDFSDCIMIGVGRVAMHID